MHDVTVRARLNKYQKICNMFLSIRIVYDHCLVLRVLSSPRGVR